MLHQSFSVHRQSEPLQQRSNDSFVKLRKMLKQQDRELSADSDAGASKDESQQCVSEENEVSRVPEVNKETDAEDAAHFESGDLQ